MNSNSDNMQLCLTPIVTLKQSVLTAVVLTALWLYNDIIQGNGIIKAYVVLLILHCRKYLHDEAWIIWHVMMINQLLKYMTVLKIFNSLYAHF